MTEFAKMDVFFYVTTVAVIILTVVLAVAIIYIASILKDVKYITKKARAEAAIISEELSDLRENVKEQGAKLKYFTKFFYNIYKKSRK